MLVMTVYPTEVLRIEHAGEVVEIKVRALSNARWVRHQVCLEGPRSFDVSRVPDVETALGRKLEGPRPLRKEKA
jgi:hypothetical protein